MNMAKQNLPMNLTISRIHGGDKNIIRISIQDDNSRAHFVEMDLSLSDFAECVTGLAHMKGIGTVRGLDKIGKIMEHDTITVKIPGDLGYGEKRTEAAQTEIANTLIQTKRSEDGWILCDTLNSQNSFTYDFEKKETVVRANIRRWV